MKLLKFNEFINEGLITLKRKYTDLYPEKKISTHATTREKLIVFIAENKPVSKKKLQNFLSSVNEKTGSTTSLKWVSKNKSYVKTYEQNGQFYFKLTPLGEKLYSIYCKTLKENEATLDNTVGMGNVLPTDVHTGMIKFPFSDDEEE